MAVKIVTFDFEKANSRLNDVIPACIKAVKAFDGREGWCVSTDWLDDECFVINLKPLKGFGDFESREALERYVNPLLFALGNIAEKILDDCRTEEEKEKGYWNCYSELNAWNEDGNDWECDEWSTLQAEVRWEQHSM